MMFPMNMNIIHKLFSLFFFLGDKKTYQRNLSLETALAEICLSLLKLLR